MYVECVEGAGRSGSAECVAESVRTHVRCEGDVGSVGAVCRGHLFHTGPQNPWTHAVVGVSGYYGDEKGNQ